jgi:hypothetical protein
MLWLHLHGKTGRSNKTGGLASAEVWKGVCGGVNSRTLDNEAQAGRTSRVWADVVNPQLSTLLDPDLLAGAEGGRHLDFLPAATFSPRPRSPAFH